MPGRGSSVAGGLAFGYDARGNLVSDSVNSFQYDIDNHLTGVNATASLVTDPLGRLAAVNDLVGGAPGAGSRTFRCEGERLLAEYGVAGAESGVMKARHVPGPGVDETVVSYSDATTTNRQWLLADERGDGDRHL
jgi:hypothetical protein